MHTDTRRIGSRTPLRDHAGEVLGWYDAGTVRQLMDRADVIVIGTRHRIKGLRFAGPDPAHLLMSGSIRRKPMEAPHRKENYWNPSGVWCFHRLPASLRRLYLGVITDCVRQEARVG